MIHAEQSVPKSDVALRLPGNCYLHFLKPLKNNSTSRWMENAMNQKRSPQPCHNDTDTNKKKIYCSLEIFVDNEKDL